MPYAFRQAGVVLGMIILVVVALITDYSLILMVRGGELSGTKSYQVGFFIEKFDLSSGFPLHLFKSFFRE